MQRMYGHVFWLTFQNLFLNEHTWNVEFQKNDNKIAKQNTIVKKNPATEVEEDHRRSISHNYCGTSIGNVSEL